MNTRQHIPRIVMLAEACSGGVWRHLTLVAPALRDRGVTVDLILSDVRTDPGFEQDVAELRDRGCAIQRVKLHRRPAPVADLAAIVRVRRLLRRCCPCILHTHAAKAGLVGRVAALGLRGVRTVHSPHAFFFEAWPRGLRRMAGVRLERLLARGTDAYALVSCAEHQLATGVCGVPPDRLHVIENGLPDSFYSALASRSEARELLGIAAAETAVGFMGRISPQKGADILLDAVKELVEFAGTDTPAVPRVILLGDGPDRARLEAEAARRGIGSHLTWTGYRRDASQLWTAFDLAVFPGRYEALPYALLEALGAGVPAIVSDIPGHFPRPEMRDRLERFENGSANALAQSIQRLATDEQRRSVLARWGADRVRSEFTLERQTAQLSELYASLTAAGHRVGA